MKKRESGLVDNLIASVLTRSICHTCIRISCLSFNYYNLLAEWSNFMRQIRNSIADMENPQSSYQKQPRKFHQICFRFIDHISDNILIEIFHQRNKAKGSSRRSRVKLVQFTHVIVCNPLYEYRDKKWTHRWFWHGLDMER